MTSQKAKALNKSWMFKKLFGNCKKIVEDPFLFHIHYPEEHEGPSKLAFNIRKKVRSASGRNKLRRVVKSLFFERASGFSRPAWIVCTIRPFSSNSKEFSLSEFRQKATKLLEKV